MASADYVEVEKDGVFYGLYTDYLTAEVISNPNGYTGDIVIAETVVYNDVNYNVTTISNGSFLNGNLSSITIPKTIKTISGYAFRDSQGFNECKGPAVIKISNLSAWCSIDLDQHSIGYGYQLFLNGVEINDLVVPNDVSVINEYAFYGCKSIKTVTIPGNVSSIGRAAFRWCDNLTSVNMEDGVKTIGREAFRSCGALSSVTFPPNLVSIEKDAFNGCSSLASAAIPEGVTKINASTFKGCSSLKSLSIPNSVTDIESGAFYDCSSLASVTIPNSVTYIGPNTFQGCSNLETIELSNDLTRITDYMFYDCGKLNSIVIPGGVTSIENGSFQNCANLPSINIPKTVTSIASAAFSGCSSLTSIELPAGLGSIGESVFSGCTALTTVTILDGLTTIAHGSFSGCSSLTTITIPASVTGIRDYAFEGCENLSSVNISDLVSWCKIDFSSWNSNPLNYAHHLFLNGEEIKDVVLSDNLTSIARWAFSGCSSISSVAIPNSITSIGAYAFNDCNNMTLVTISNSIGGLPDGTFSGCSSLTSIDLPNSIKSLGEDVFRLSGLTSVIIPNGVTKIGPGAFSECKNLSDVTIPETITSIGNYAFWYCKNLTKIISQITAPQTVTIYGDALLDVNKDAIILVPCGTKGLYESTDVLKDFKICEADYCAPEDAIIFEDEEVEKACLDPDKWNLDTNHDGYLTKDEAAAVTSLNIKNYAYLFKSFDEFQYFTGLTLIPDYTFRDCEKLTSIIIPNSITYIGIEAFRGCTGLTSITVPKSVTTMDNRVFLYCTGLTSVTFEGSVIGDDPFGTSTAIIDYSKLTSVTIGENVKTIGESAFHGLKGVTSITIPDGVTTIGAWAFCKCTGLNSLTIGKNVNTMGKGAFSSCSNLRSIVSYILEPFEIEMYTFDSSLGAELKVPTGTKEKYLALDYWKDFKNIVEMESSEEQNDGEVFTAKTIEGVEMTFQVISETDKTCQVGTGKPEEPAVDKTYEGAVTIPAEANGFKVTTVGKYALTGSKITSVIVSEGIESIGYGAFANCHSLDKLVLPSTLTSIGAMIVDGSRNLTTVVSNSKSPCYAPDFAFISFSVEEESGGGNALTRGWDSEDLIENTDPDATPDSPSKYRCPATLYVPAGTIEKYVGGWKYFRNIVEMENQVVEQGYAVFDSETGTLTFKYGEKPAGDNVYDTDNTDYTWESQAWDCSQIKKVVFDPSFAAARPKSTTHWFYKSESLTEIVGIEYLNTSEVTTMRGMFSGCGNLTNLDVHKFVTDNVTNMAWMFENCSSLKSLDVSKFNTSNVTDLGAMFDNCPSLTNLDVSHFDTGNAKSLNSMFRGCSGLTSLDVSNFNTGNATDVCGMFENCSSLKSLDVSKFNTSNVTDLGAMFANCPSLTSLDVRHFDTSNAKSLNSMFRDCSGLTLIDLSSFDTNNAINMGAMFKNCNSLTTIHVGEKWNTTNVEDSDEMFAGCEKLVGGKGTAYDADHVDATYARIDGGVDNPGYYTGTVSESITISKALQVTYMSDKNLDFTGYPDLKAYVATGYDKASGTIWLTRVKYVPANTGILLMGEAGDYEIPVKKGESTSYYMNLFKGTIEGTTIQTTDGDNTNYYLSKGDAGVGFYKVQGSVELKPNRAYLSVPTEIPVVGATGSTETIKVSAAGQVPYYNSQSLDFSSLDAQGVKAYTATGYDYNSGTIWLTRVKQVPAETGILIMAPQGEYPVPTASISSVYANMFKGTLTGTTIQTHETIADEDYINYYLSSGDAGVGFYKVTKEGGVSIGANRCYLPIKNKDAAGTRSAGSRQSQIAFEEADEVIGISLLRGIGGDEDGTTSIKDLTPALSEGEGAWYTLQGQRVAKPGKGLYIHNGKKIVVR